jgi:hypothetical protein
MGNFSGSTLLSVLCEETCLLVSWCAGDRWSMAGNDKDRGRSRRLGADDRGWSSTGRVLDDQTIERLGDTVCSLQHAQGDEEHVFLGLASKPKSAVSPGLASKPVATILVVWHQNHSLGFPGLGLKTRGYGLVIWPTKSSRQFLCLGLKTKWEEICQFVPQIQCADEDGVRTRIDIRWLASSGSKSGRGFLSLASKLVKERRRVVHVTSSRRSCGCEEKDGRFDGADCDTVEVRPNYPSFDVIFLLAHRGILVFSFCINRTPNGWWRGKHSAILLPPPSYSYFLRGVGMLHSVREEEKSERSF